MILRCRAGGILTENKRQIAMNHHDWSILLQPTNSRELAMLHQTMAKKQKAVVTTVILHL